MSSPKPQYEHPYLKPAYSRTEANGTIFESVYDTGNGHAVRVRQSAGRDIFVCELLIVPQFPGASIYNSVRAGEPPLETTIRDDVTEFINTAVEAFMLEVTKLQENPDD